jgi:serine phosphatase RsbU (regulator of sigma subunit)
MVKWQARSRDARCTLGFDFCHALRAGNLMATAERTLRVLLIEDDDDQAVLIERQLKRSANGTIQITRADRLAIGIQALQRERFDTVLLDLNLPDSRGLSTCYRICDSAPDTPVIAMTAIDMAADGVRLVREKAEDYFPKINLDGEFILRAILCAVERTERRRAEGQLNHAAGQLEAARRIQSALLPEKAPQIQGFEVAALSEPAEMVGGDYFDFLVAPDGRVFIALGDIAGHGPAAAMMMAVATGSLRTAFWLGGDVGTLLTRVNAVLEHFPPRTTMMTMFIVELDSAARTFHYASAAHPYCYLFGADGELKDRLNTETDVPLGIVGDHVFETSPLMALEPGEAILIVSDGVLESGVSRHCQFGETRLLATVKENYQNSAAHIVKSIITAATEFRQGGAAEDDITLVIVRANRQ